MPESLWVDAIAGTEPLVVLGQSNEANRSNQVLWHSGTDFETAAVVDELLPDLEYPRVSQITYFNERFYAFVTDDAGSDTDVPQMLVSEDGVAWTLKEIDSTPPTTATLIAYTPPSPPSGDRAAVVGATVSGDRMFATGWMSPNGNIETFIWSTNDGDVWDAQRIPTLNFDSQYGSSIAIGPRGTMLGLGGPRYQGIGTLVSTDSERWRLVDDLLEIESPVITDISAGSDGLQVLIDRWHDLELPTVLGSSVDGVEWDLTVMPELPPSPDRDFFQLGSAERPTVFLSPDFDSGTQSIWELTDVGWIQNSVEGQQVLETSDDRIVTWEPGILRGY